MITAGPVARNETLHVAKYQGCALWRLRSG